VAAADRLGRSEGGDQVVEALLGALHDPYAQVRGSAAFALGRLGDLRAV
jgi:HEAT repeat protein